MEVPVSLKTFNSGSMCQEGNVANSYYAYLTNNNMFVEFFNAVNIHTFIADEMYKYKLATDPMFAFKQRVETIKACKKALAEIKCL